MRSGHSGLGSLLLGIAACAAGSSTPAERPVMISDGRPSMGTLLQIQLEVHDPRAGRKLLAELYEEAARLEGILTTYDPTSATERLNASGESEIPPELQEALARGVAAAQETGGVFDISIGPLIHLWSVAAERNTLPTPAEISEAKNRVGAAGIRVGGGRARLATGMRIDFGGLGKGWALDRLGQRLNDNVIAALFDFGGSSWLARGTPEGEPGWRVLVSSHAGHRRIVTLRDESLSVSESLGQSTEIEGKRFSHVLDPRTGWPTEEARLAAVRSPSGSTAEVWSTALLVLGPDGLAEVSRLGHEALLLDEAGTRHATPGFGDQTLFPLQTPVVVEPVTTSP